MPDTAVVTVRGPIPASELGVTLMHEHILVDMLREHRLDGLLNDVPLALAELGRFRSAGGRSIVDLTNRSLGQQPAALHRISELSGLHIVLGCGFYRQPYLDEQIDRTSTDDLASLMVRDLTEGIDGTGVRAGIIGEIACEGWITAREERVFRAAARAHRQTGVTISTHAARWPVGLLQLDLLAEEGVDPRRVVIGHSDTVASTEWLSPNNVLDYHEELARRGAFVEFDLIRPSANVPVEYATECQVKFVLNLMEKGYGRQILLSQDICFKSSLWTYGGGGYDYLLTHFVPRLTAAGLSDRDVDMLLIDNPRSALTGGAA